MRESGTRSARIGVANVWGAPEGNRVRIDEMGRIDAAIEALDTALGLGPSKWDAETHYYRGIALERRGELDESLVSYLAAAAADPREARFHLAAAEILIDLGRLDEAQATLLGQDGQFDSRAGFRQGLGYVAMLRQELDAAVSYFKEATILSPGDPVLVEDLAMAQVTAKLFADAEDSLDQLNDSGVLDKRPDLKVLWASCLLELDRPVEARSILVPMALGSGDDDPEVWVRLIDVALALDDEWMLRNAAGQMITAAPARYEGYVAQAIWKRRAGDLEGALESVDRAIDFAHDNPTPRRLRDILQRQAAAAARGS